MTRPPDAMVLALMNAANTRTIYRRTDWQEPVEDT